LPPERTFSLLASQQQAFFAGAFTDFAGAVAGFLAAAGLAGVLVAAFFAGAFALVAGAFGAAFLVEVFVAEDAGFFAGGVTGWAGAFWGSGEVFLARPVSLSINRGFFAGASPDDFAMSCSTPSDGQ
jgi:hypothetical protein